MQLRATVFFIALMSATPSAHAELGVGVSSRHDFRRRLFEADM